jgi:hypothetical protein
VRRFAVIIATFVQKAFLRLGREISVSSITCQEKGLTFFCNESYLITFVRIFPIKRNYLSLLKSSGFLVDGVEITASVKGDRIVRTMKNLDTKPRQNTNRTASWHCNETRNAGLYEVLDHAGDSCFGRHAVEITEIKVTYKKRVCVFSREHQLLTNTTLALRNRERPRSRFSR